MDLADAVLLGIGALLGAGIFVAPGYASELAGPALLLSVLLAGAVALVTALAAATLAAGGLEDSSADLRRVNPLAGHAAGWMALAARVVAAAMAGKIFAAYLSPGAPPAAARAMAAGLIVALAAVRIAGFRVSPRVNGALVAIVLAALAFFTGLALPLVSRFNLRPFAPHGFGGAWQAAALLYFLYAGEPWPGLEAMIKPERTVPRAAALSVVLCMVLYLLVSLAAVGAGGPLFTGHDLQGRPYDAPLGIVAAFTTMPGAARVAVTIGAIAAAILVLLSILGRIGRLSAMMARSGSLPLAVTARLPGSTVPWPALLVCGAISAFLATTASVSALLGIAAFCALLHAAGANAAAVLLRQGGRWLRALCAVGFIACVLLALSLPRAAVLSGLAVLAAGLAVYPLRGLWKVAR